MCIRDRFRSLLDVFCRSVLQNLGDRSVIGNHETVESPLLSQDIGHHPFVGCSRYVAVSYTHLIPYANGKVSNVFTKAMENPQNQATEFFKVNGALVYQISVAWFCGFSIALVKTCLLYTSRISRDCSLRAYQPA